MQKIAEDRDEAQKIEEEADEVVSFLATSQVRLLQYVNQ